MKITSKQLRQLVREEVERQQLEEKVALDSVAGKIRQTVNTCANYVNDQLQFVKKNRPNWQNVAATLKDAYLALEAAHQALLDQAKEGK